MIICSIRVILPPRLDIKGRRAGKFTLRLGREWRVGRVNSLMTRPGDRARWVWGHTIDHLGVSRDVLGQAMRASSHFWDEEIPRLLGTKLPSSPPISGPRAAWALFGSLWNRVLRAGPPYNDGPGSILEEMRSELRHFSWELKMGFRYCMGRRCGIQPGHCNKSLQFRGRTKWESTEIAAPPAQICWGHRGQTG